MKPLTGTTADTIMLQPFPAYDAALEDEQALNDLEWIKQTIIAVRNIRAEMNIAPSKALDVLLRNCSADAQRRVQENQSFIARLARPNPSRCCRPVIKARSPSPSWWTAPSC